MKNILLCLFIVFSATIQAQKIKVACVGNSVTYGHGIENREKNSYPAQLQRMLGNEYEVANFGKSGATLLRKGHRPYNEQEECKAALDFAADRVVIHLGLNDTDPRDWPNYRDDFTKDYLTLIDAFRQANPKCEIWICRLTPISHRHTRFKSGTRDWYWQIQQNIEDIAVLAHTGLIDLHTELYDRPDLLPDALHPTAEGAGIIARTVYRALTGNYGGLQMPVIYSDNMVLQREKPLRIAGTANAGEKVAVSIAGQKGEAITASDGKWSVILPPMKAGGPYTLSISAESGKLDYTNILIGEVWLCSGQSNMAFQVSSAVDSQRKAFLEFAARKPQIRLFDMKPRWLTNAVEWDISTLDSLNRLQYYRDTEWKECNEETANRFSAIAFAFGQMLSDSLQVPVGLILNAIGGSPAEAWIDRKTLEFEFPDILYDWKQNNFIQDWARERAALNIRKSTNKQQRHPYEPCYLYESGIQPLEKFPIRGIIWYQGEFNSGGSGKEYATLFSRMITDWREKWGIGDFPFVYVQLPNFEPVDPEPSVEGNGWRWVREGQLKALNLPNTAMAVTIDVGDPFDLHPVDKYDVGHRLALAARKLAYGEKIVGMGPLYKKMSVKGNKIILEFTNQGKKLVMGTSPYIPAGKPPHPKPTKLTGFGIAGADRKFVWADAVIEGNKVIVSSSEVAVPVAVRYGFSNSPRCNLYNEKGLPASPFRTDSWDK